MAVVSVAENLDDSTLKVFWSLEGAMLFFCLTNDMSNFHWQCLSFCSSFQNISFTSLTTQLFFNKKKSYNAKIKRKLFTKVKEKVSLSLSFSFLKKENLGKKTYYFYIVSEKVCVCARACNAHSHIHVYVSIFFYDYCITGFGWFAPL